jgi:hypothetical protein
MGRLEEGVSTIREGVEGVEEGAEADSTTVPEVEDLVVQEAHPR